MSKQKTKSSARKRFHLMESGKIKRKQVGMRHNLGKKEKKRKLRLVKNTYVHKSDIANIKDML